MSVHSDVFGMHPKPFVTQFECHILQSVSVLIDVGALLHRLFEKQADKVVPRPVSEHCPSVALYILHESVVP